jgi:hypothetical protein
MPTRRFKAKARLVIESLQLVNRLVDADLALTQYKLG